MARTDRRDRYPRISNVTRYAINSIITEDKKAKSLVLSDGLLQVLPDGTITSTYTATASNGTIAIIKSRDIEDNAIKPSVRYPALLFTRTDTHSIGTLEIKKEVPEINELIKTINLNILLKLKETIQVGNSLIEVTFDALTKDIRKRYRFGVEINEGDHFKSIRPYVYDKNDTKIYLNYDKVILTNIIDINVVLSNGIYNTINVNSYRFTSEIEAKTVATGYPPYLSILSHVDGFGLTEMIIEDITLIAQ